MIRFAKSKDIDDIMQLLHQVNDVHAQGRPDLFVMGRTKYKPDEVESILSDDSTPIFVFTDDDDHLQAYCFCLIQDHKGDPHLQPIKTLYIDDLCVDETLRGKHIGKQLYEYVKEWACSNGFHNLTLNVWSCNPKALAFYQSLGLVPQKITLEARF